MSEKEGCRRTDCSQQTSKAGTMSSAILRKYPPHAVHFIWFSDEKLFTVAAPSNLQNDRVYVLSSVKKKDVDAARLLRTRPAFCKSLMVSVAVSSLGAKQVHFLEPGVNGDYYQNTVLLNMLLLDIRSVSGITTFFSKMEHRRIVHVTLSPCCRERCQSLSLQRCGHPICQI